MKKVFLMILVLAALAVSCISGFRYTELMAYDPDEDWQCIANSEYAYLTTLNGGIEAEELFDVLNDFFVASERIYVQVPSLSDSYSSTYRVMHDVPLLLPFLAYMEENSTVEKPDLETQESLYVQMTDPETYTFNNVLMWMGVYLWEDYALIHITPTAGGSTQTFCVSGDHREKWRWYWEEIISEKVIQAVSAQNSEVMDVFLYGNEFYEAGKNTSTSIFEYTRPVQWYAKPFPLPIDAFDGGSYDL